MVSRKSHPKSRNGCAQCKRRRIKCNEVRPRCDNCVKHDIDCDFSSCPTTEVSATTSPRIRKHRSSDTKSIPVSTESNSTTESSIGESPVTQYGSIGRPRDRVADLQMNDLELLHHFVTETCFTLSDRQESHSLWQITAPQEAFKHDFLMRGMLAIAALHLSHLKPLTSDHYAHIAAQHQDAALSCFRQLMSKMDQTNCDAFFALSSLIVVYGFESPKAADSLGMFSYKGDHPDEWLPLIRGVNSILQSVFPWIKSGKLSGLLHDHDRGPSITDIPSVLDDQLVQLESLCADVRGGEEAVVACRTAVGQLRHCFVRMNNKMPYECEVSLAFLWPVMIPTEFISMLNEKRPEALIILAHYCVILHHLDDYWWMKGWAMHIIGNIDRELSEDWRCWIQWPFNVISVRQKILTNGKLQNLGEGNHGDESPDTMQERNLANPDQPPEPEPMRSTR